MLESLDLALHSNHFHRVRRRIRMLGIDTTHFVRDRRSTGSSGRWSDDDLRAAVSLATGVADVIRRLGLIPAGGNYDRVQRRMRELQLDTSHFLGRGWNTQAKYITPIALPLEEVLVVVV